MCGHLLGHPFDLQVLKEMFALQLTESSSLRTGLPCKNAGMMPIVPDVSLELCWRTHEPLHETVLFSGPAGPFALCRYLDYRTRA